MHFSKNLMKAFWKEISLCFVHVYVFQWLFLLISLFLKYPKTSKAINKWYVRFDDDDNDSFVFSEVSGERLVVGTINSVKVV